MNAACQGNLSAYHFWHPCHRFVSPVLGGKCGKYVGLTTLETSSAEFLEILGVSNCWKTKGLYRPVMD